MDEHSTRQERRAEWWLRALKVALYDYLRDPNEATLATFNTLAEDYRLHVANGAINAINVIP